MPRYTAHLTDGTKLVVMAATVTANTGELVFRDDQLLPIYTVPSGELRMLLTDAGPPRG